MEGYGVLAAATVAAQPNVVLILADDLGYGDIGANGGTTIATSTGKSWSRATLPTALPPRPF